ncbi:uncharacterized protein [Lepeophtheirus salmonis]|uniref:uncharacterized protein isoform X2 n=1 Tax=Lepeophtheirus salmonis TaxID=72036 RepID=UPI001AE7EE43|nr:LIM domain-binding protein 2-like isoform X2 [Lepeophtheirus salmonis]
MENGPLGGGGGGPSPNFASPNGPGTPTMPGTPTYPIQNYGPSPVGGPSQLVPCGPPSGPHGFVGSPVGNSGPSTPGPMVHTPIGNGGGPGNSNGPNSNILNNGGNSNIVQPPPPPPNHCGQQPPNSFHPPPQYNGMGSCGPCVPNSPSSTSSSCGPSSLNNIRGQSPNRPGSSGPPYMPNSGGGSPFPPSFGLNGPPIGPPHMGGGMQGPLPPHHHQYLGGPPQNYGPPPGMHHPGMSPGHHGAPMGPHMGAPPPHFMDRMDPNRHMAMPPQPDYRIHEMNKRLQQRTDDSDNLWWDAFTTEFFEEDATFTLTFCLEDGPKRYTISRTLIPRYFRSIFEGGVTDLHYELRHPKESFHNNSITMDCDQCTVVTLHGKPMFTKSIIKKVFTEGRLVVEFSFDDSMRIRSWHFSIRNHRELIPRSVLALQDPGMPMESLSKNITRQGLTSTTLNYLRLCVILEPMQELMSRHKAYALNPRDCLKTTLFQKWQKMVAPPVNSPSRESTPSRGGGGSRSTRGRGGRHSGARSSPHLDLLSGEDLEPTRGGNKRRKRKGAGSTVSANKKRSPGPNFSLASQDVMVVGEPSLMGGEFGEEDERLISRLENAQYDPAAAAAQAAAAAAQQHHHHQHMDDGYGPSMAWSSGPPPPQAPPGSIPVSQQQIQQPPPPSSSSVIVPKTELEIKKSPKNC